MVCDALFYGLCLLGAGGFAVFACFRIRWVVLLFKVGYWFACLLIWFFSCGLGGLWVCRVNSVVVLLTLDLLDFIVCGGFVYFGDLVFVVVAYT